MNGNSVAARGNQDSRLASALRVLTDRVRALESRPLRRYGGVWMLGTNEHGDLVGIHEPSGVVRVLAVAPENEGR